MRTESREVCRRIQHRYKPAQRVCARHDDHWRLQRRVRKRGSPLMKKKKNVVIVNDDITQLCIISGILDIHGFQTRTYTSAADALTAMESTEVPDAVITDIQMPDLDGWRFCRLLRSEEHKGLNGIPILATSAIFKDDESENVSKDIGADAFLPAPFDAGTLLQAVDSLFSSAAPLRKTRLLIVDDAAERTESYEEVLKSSGYDVVHANPQDNVLQSIAKLAPEIILIDDRSPRINSQEILKLIRRRERPPVALVIASDNQAEACSRYRREGANAHVHAPLDAEYLLAECERTIRERAFEQVEILLQKRTWELQESRERYKSMMESLADPMYIAAESYDIEYCNTAMKRLIGDTGVEGKCFRIIFGNEDVCSWCPMQKIQHQAAVRFNIESDFHHRIFDVTASALVHPDQSISQTAILHDITRKVNLEAQLMQTQKLEAIGRLAAGVAHGFNNMLGAIMGYADMIREDNCENGVPIDHRLNKRIDMVLSATSRAAGLVRQLLGFARQGKYCSVPVSVNNLVKALQELLKHGAHKEIDMRLALCADEPIVVGDPHQIQNAILNIALNACDAMNEGGALTFETQIVESGHANHAGGGEQANTARYVRIGIVDTGVGMDEETKKHIFEPFFSTKSDRQGTGLGLAGAYGAVKNHNGYIEVQSSAGCGSRFDIYLPAAEESVNTISAEEMPGTHVHYAW
ncbi:MAG: response regulator [Chitinivibrionales bacterium]|nr:response regulator [Chitinivibrionales bacterium]